VGHSQVFGAVQTSHSSQLGLQIATKGMNTFALHEVHIYKPHSCTNYSTKHLHGH